MRYTGGFVKHTEFTALLIVVICSMLLSACTVGPDYVRPTAVETMPTSYKELGEWKVAQPQDKAVPERWWELYGDPLLSSLVEQVAISNLNVAAAEANYRQARALVQAARAGYYPTLSIGAAATRSETSANTGSGRNSGTTSSNFNLPLDLTWELDLWGRIRRGVESSQAGAQASAADLAAATLSAQAQLAANYFQLRTLDGQKQLLDSIADVYKKALELTNNRYAAGVAAKSDVLLAETQLKSTQAQAIDLGVQRAQLEHAIALLIGKPAASFSLTPAPMSLETVPPAIPVGVPSVLLERRADIASAERRMAAANAQIGVAEAAWYPTITLSAAGGFESSSIAKWLAWPSRFWAIGPSLSQTVFDGGLRQAHNTQARAAYDGTVAAYRQTVLTGFNEVEDSLAALRILEDEARVQDDAVKAAKQSVAIVRNQYKAGTVGYLSVIVIQASEQANEMTSINILGRRMNASVLLIKALGGGWVIKEPS
jgi:NodT family efflux transporter outer membrane factor (OMF) lipoprotein